ncbi:cell adhesion molecule Dscam1-like [Ornithodoros turicata]|uniref:cell adhesion molecule Dscam1-like n=1 Tax=Ornithodoros turicata TaxID=34597 RepID=UPI003139C894
MEGKTVTVACTTTTSLQNVQYRWLRNGKPLRENARVKFGTLPQLSALILGPLQETDAGNYTCLATYGRSRSSYGDALNVLVPPKWEQEPLDISVKEGDNVTQPCEAKGYPKPEIKIKKEGTDSFGATGSLIISKASKHNGGTYTCHADNGVGKGLIKPFKVIIYGKLSITQ